MIQKFRKHPYPKHYVAYSINHLFYALLRSGLGPLIPYLSQKSGIIQTEYSFFFSCRSFGMLAGALLLKLVQRNYPIVIHKQMIFASLVIFLTSWFFSSTFSLFWQGVWLTISSMSYSIYEIQMNVCLLRTNLKQDVQFWMLLTNGLFGIGGLIGPLIVYVFGTNSFTIIGIICLLLIPFYYVLQSPEQQNSDLQDNKNVAIPKATQKITPRKIEALLCASMFIYIGLESTYGGWISSFSILADVSSKQNATIYPSVFWLFATIFRFIIAFMPGTANEKLQKQIQMTIGCGILSLILIHIGYTHLSCYFSAIMFGATLSSIYALILTVSTLYGFTLAEYQTENIVICGVLGEGVLAMFVGVLMEQIHINMLFYGMTIMVFAMEIIRRFQIKYFGQDQENAKDTSLQLAERLIKT